MSFSAGGGARATILARCVHGIEWACADEISSRLPEAAEVTQSRREVTFTVPGVAAPLELRTADDVLLLVGHVEGVGTTKDAPPALARRVRHLPFAAALAQVRTIRTVPGRPRFDVVASLEGRRGYNRYAVENAIGAELAPVLDGSYLERTSQGRSSGEPDLTVRVFIRGSTAVVALRLGRRPLHRRDYKQDTGPATLHPPLAAAMARLVGAPGVLLDPFCGDGTIAIEAALSYPDALVVASDISLDRLTNARSNARRAGAGAALVRADVADPPWRAGGVDAMVTNPPWGIAVDAVGRLRGRVDPLWAWLPDVLSRCGRACLVTDAEAEIPALLRGAGYSIALAARIRLAGRISHLVLCAPPRRPVPAMPSGVAAWRGRAIAEGVVTDAGF